MNVLIQTPQAESKDIKLSNKKDSNTKSNEEKDFFENIISDILSDTAKSKNKSFLLSKLLNLSSEFEKKEQTLSDFSDGKLFTDNQIGQISIQELLKIATQIKNAEDPTFPTDSKALKTALLKPDVVEEFKSAKNIKELLDIAKKNKIEVKNFQFFKEEAALDPKDKKMVQKIKSEDIFKLIERQLGIKADKNITTLNNPKELIKQNEKKTTILQTILSSKEIIKPTTKTKIESEKTTILETKDTQKTVEIKKLDQKQTTSDKPELEVQVKKESKIESGKIVTTETKETPKDTQKTKNLDQKQTTSDKSELAVQVKKDFKKIVTTETKETPKDTQKIVETKKLDQKQTTSDKPELAVQVKENQKIVKRSFDTVLNTKKIDQKQNTLIKPESIAENRDIQTIENKETGDKTVQNIETKTSHVEKTKNSHEFKRTFNTFAQEFKEKVENYKAPLMKIKMELKPAGLGDVDVTLLSRGNNLQVNINSNANTIAMFAQNQVEFRNSLINMGFSDLQMNFGDGQKKGNENQNGKNSKNSFETFQEQEKEDTDGFEIIVPQYG